MLAFAIALLLWTVILPVKTQALGATTCASIASGNWSEASSWNCDIGTIPTTGINVVINGHAMTLDSGDLTIGTLTMNAGGSIATGVNTLTLGGDFSYTSSVDAGFISGKLNLGAATRTFTVSDDDSIDPDFTISAVVSGGTGAGIIKAGANSNLELSGNNTYDGPTSVTAGALMATHANALGATSAGTTVNSGYSLILSGGITTTEPLTLNGAGFGSLGALFTGSGTNVANGAVTLGSNATIATVGAGTLVVAGQITDGASSFGLTIKNNSSSNKVVLRGANTFDGLVTVATGTLRVEQGSALGTTASGTTVSSGATLEVANGITLAEPLSINGLGVSSSGALLNGSGDNIINGTITLLNNAVIGASTGTTLTAASEIDDGANGYNMAKVGEGRLALDGYNTYSGATTVSAGTLLINGGNTSTSEMTVAAGATLGGTGSTNAVTVNAGGMLEPGLSPGLISVYGLTMSDGSTLSIELGGTTAGTTYDQVDVTGNVTLAGSLSIAVVNNFIPARGDVFTIINNDDSDLVSGSFSGLSEGSTLTIGSFVFEISYKGGGGNDVVLTAIESDISVFGNNNEIGNEDITPTSTDGTDFGTVVVGQALTHTFTINNDGNGPLYLFGSSFVTITGGNDFVVVQPLSGSIAGTDFLDFDVVFAPTVKGSRSVTLTIGNSDADENPYTFRLQGNGLAQYDVEVSKTGNGNGTVTSDPAGVDCGETCTLKVDDGAAMTLTATADVSSDFAGWTGACSGMGDCALTVDADTAVTATFTLKQFNVVVSKDGTGSGTVTSKPAGVNCGITCTLTVDYGTVVTLTANANINSNFMEWGSDCGGDQGCELTVDSDKTVTATFAIKQFTLNVYADGNGTVTSVPAGIHCGVTCTITVDYGKVFTLTVEAGTGSEFSNWGDACSGSNSKCVVTMTDDRSVDAYFSLKQYDMDVSKDGNGSGTVTSTPSGIDCGDSCGLYSQDYGTKVTLTATPDAGSEFTGWSGDCSGMDSCKITVTSYMNVYATFTLKQFDVNVSKDGNGTGTVTSDPAGVSCGITCTLDNVDYGTVVTLTPMASVDSEFAGWAGACSGTSDCITTVEATTTITATFNIKQFDVAVSKEGNGSGMVTSDPAGVSCGITCTLNDLEYGTVITLTAVPDVGSEFNGWGGACSGNGNCVVTVDAAKTVIASFILKQYELSISTDGNGSGMVTNDPSGSHCASTSCSMVYHGTVVTLTATVDASSNFVGWGGDCSGIGNCVITVDAAKSVMATFTLKQYSLSVSKAGNGSGTVTSNPAGVSCGITCTLNDLDYGTVVTLMATADVGSEFAGWGGACSGLDECMVTFVEAKQVVATFTLKSYGVTVSKAGNGSGTVTSNPAGINCGATCTLDLVYGSSITLSATPDASSNFVGWGGPCSGTDACVVTVDAAEQVIATFALKEYPATITFAGEGSGHVSSTPIGVDCSDSCVIPFFHGTALTLNTVADDGSTFVGWGGACSGTSSCVVDVTRPVTIVVTYGKATAESELKMGGESVAGSAVHFSADLPMNSVESCEWDFGDGSQQTCDLSALGTMAVHNVQVSASHVYAEEGNYTVTVTAANEAGTVMLSLSVVIGSPTAEHPVAQPMPHGLFMPMLSSAGAD